MTGTAKLDHRRVEADFEPFRRELTAYCYRMLGSAFEADDAVQETMVRAWRGIDRFEGRSELRTWLYRIASNVCFDMLRGRQRRALPMDLNGPTSGAGPVDPPQPELPWIGPIPDGRVVPLDADPAETAVMRESIRIAFVAALQHLPARQRAVLILREVLKWRASEVAELLDTSVVSVNSALQRARATLAQSDLERTPPTIDADQQELLSRYVDAFERFDVESLVALLHEDATMSMPPYKMWMRGADEYARFLVGPGAACRGSRFENVEANGAPALAQWRRSPDGGYDAWAIHVLELSDGRVAGITFFVDPELFPLFDLPVHVDLPAPVDG
jgi:RNA polymerase sigma-70 factor (ECF subfamily)